MKTITFTNGDKVLTEKNHFSEEYLTKISGGRGEIVSTKTSTKAEIKAENKRLRQIEDAYENAMQPIEDGKMQIKHNLNSNNFMQGFQ